MRPKHRTAWLTLATALSVTPLRAGVGVWTSHGPGPVRSVAVDPSTPRLLYAGGPERVFRSEDGGESWVPSEAFGRPAGFGGEIQTIAVDTTNPLIVYAGTSSQCPVDLGRSVIFKSFDSGRFWFEAQPGIRCLSIPVIVLHPSQPHTLFATTFPTIRSSVIGVLRSDDGGLNWTLVGSPPCVVFDLSVESDRMLAATGGCGVWQSFDSGVTWEPVSGGLEGSAARAVQAVARIPLGPSHLVIGTLMGIYRTNDGTNWTATEVRAPTADIAADPAHPGRVFAATLTDGVLRSDDGGAHWTPFNEGLTTREVRRLALDPSGRFLYAGTPAGIFQYEFPPCDPARDANCLGLQANRFRVTVSASDTRSQRTGEGLASKQSEEFGWFSLPLFTGDPNNPEVFVKILDGRTVNGHFWVFHSGLTDLGYMLSVTDTTTGETRNYRKDSGTACGGFETSHF